MDPVAPLPLPAALSALKWQLDIGVDEALGDALADLNGVASFTPLPTPPATTPIYKVSSATTTQASAAATALPVVQAAAVTPARDLGTIKTLEELKETMASIQGLSIKDTAMNLVFGEGKSLKPDIMLIGEAPGEEEDRSGRPFVGRAGQLLEKMLAAIGYSREQVYITNVINWRPPGNRTPKAEEVATCLPYLQRHIELVQPKAIFLLGGPAAKAILGKEESVTRLRGKWWEYTPERLGLALPVRVTYHPAYLLRTPSQKRESWLDLRELKKKLETL